MTPKVLHSGPGDDVLVVLVGHGDERGLHLGLDHPPTSSDDASASVLTPAALGDAVTQMHDTGSYRRLLVVADSCFSGALGAGVVAPGAALVAAAAPDELSQATNRRPGHGHVVGRRLAYLWLWSDAGTDPDLTLGTLSQRLAIDVRWSHVTTYGTPGPTPAWLRDFVTP